MQSAFDDLHGCLEGGQGIGILSAPAGMGKTLLCRTLIAELSNSFQTVFLANSNYVTRKSLLQAILYELGHPYLRMDEQELRLELTTALKQSSARTKGVILVVDEAHLLSERLLEEIRTITNLIEKGEPLVRVLLSGQLELEEKLAAPGLDALNQRIRAQVTLEPLTRRESAEYIEFRLQWAGAELSDVFTPEAVEMICIASEGIPRCLNQLCDHSLLLSFVAESLPVTKSIVREALDDLKQLPLHWNLPESEIDSVGESPLVEADPESGGNIEQGEFGSSLELGDEQPEPSFQATSDHGGQLTETTEDESCFEFGESAVIEVGCVQDDSDPTHESADEGSIFLSKTPFASESCSEENPETTDHKSELATQKNEGGRDSEPPLPNSLEIGSGDATSMNLPMVNEDSSCPDSDIPEPGIEEELVVDQYAQIDAGGTEDKKSHTTTLLNINPDSTARRSAFFDAAGHQQRPYGLGDEIQQEAFDTVTPQQFRPDLIIESAEPLLEEVLNPNSLAERSGPNTAEQTVPLNDSRIEIGEEPIEEGILEEKIGNIVLDACLMTQEMEISDLNDSPDDEAHDHLGGAERTLGRIPLQYDVIHPEDDTSDQEAVSRADADRTRSAQAQGKYEQLFSELRRRRQG